MSHNTKKLTTEELITRAKVTHGDKYDYSKTVSINSYTKIIIICPVHGEFTQRYDAHLKGQSCPKCSGIQIPTTKEWIAKANSVHENKYEYSKTIYTKAVNKVVIICHTHGEFKISARKHIDGQGCPKCSNMFRPNTEEFIQKARLVHNKAYTYSKTIYIKAHGKLIITCPTHGDFEQKASHHVNGMGCPSCAEYGFNPNKPAYLYYLKITTDDNQILYKIGITNRTVEARFSFTDLTKIEIVKQKLYEKGFEALEWEQKLKQMYKQYQYKGSKVLKDGNTELFIEDIIAMYYKENNINLETS